MKGTLALAATLFLTACATADRPAASPNAQASAGTYYCWRERLVTEGDNLACNWSTNAGDACNAMERITINRKAVASGPENVKRCDNGQWLVQVTTR